MEGKDNRSQQNRRAMKQMKRKRGGISGGHNTTSSSSPPVRGIADVADSSDDRFVNGGTRGRWAGGSGGMLKQQERRYELDDLDALDDDIDDAQQAQMRAGDFTMMSQTPTAVGGHFKFSSEKNWDAAADAPGGELLMNTEAGEYFTLNMKLLNAGLLTIPFHKLMDYPSSMFTNDELVTMEKAAEDAEKNYQSIMQGGGSVKSGSAKSTRTPATALEGENAGVNNLADEAEKINLNTEPVTTTIAPAGAPANNDIQEWLDNVLDEGN